MCWLLCAIRVVTVSTDRFWSRLLRVPLYLLCVATRALPATCRLVRSDACCALGVVGLFLVPRICRVVNRFFWRLVTDAISLHGSSCWDTLMN